MGRESLRSAGIIYFKIDGEQLPARGAFTYALSGEQKTYECNANGQGYYTAKATPGYIKGSLTDYNDVDLARIKNAEGVTATLELGNGKIICAHNAVQVDLMEGNSETGELGLELKSDIVEEIR